MQFAILVEAYDSLVSGTDQASSGFFHDQGNHSEATLQVPKYILKHSVRLTFFLKFEYGEVCNCQVFILGI